MPFEKLILRRSGKQIDLGTADAIRLVL